MIPGSIRSAHERGQTSSRSRVAAIFTLQGAALTLAALAFALMPPRSGPVLLVPMLGHGAAGLLDEDTRLLGSGRFPGSLIIDGEHPSFLSALVDHGVLVISAVPALCGDLPAGKS